MSNCLQIQNCNCNLFAISPLWLGRPIYLYFLNHWCSFWSFGLGQSFVFFCVFHCFLCLFVRHRNRFIFYLILILMWKSKSSHLSESVVLKQLSLLISSCRSQYIVQVQYEIILAIIISSVQNLWNIIFPLIAGIVFLTYSCHTPQDKAWTMSTMNNENNINALSERARISVPPAHNYESLVWNIQDCCLLYQSMAYETCN